MDISTIITLSCAVITTLNALALTVLTCSNYMLTKKKRQDDLFDRRYAFYQRLRNMWMASGINAPHNINPELQIEDIVPFAEEASFIFGQDIVEHILSLTHKQHDGSPFFPNDDFVLPFKNYLCFKR